MDKNKYWETIKKANDQTMEWLRSMGQSIYCIHNVATFESWDKGVEVYIFFQDEIKKQEAEQAGYYDQIKQFYLSSLMQLDYPFKKFPDVVFIYDSHENVVQNYEGSYFFRLR